MMEYSQRTERKNKIADVLCVVLFIGALVPLGFGSLLKGAYGGILQSISIILVTFSLLILARYILKGFIYRVYAGDNGEPDFTVTEIRGKSSITVCRVSLLNVEEVCVRTKENEKELKSKAVGRKVFSYCPDISPEGECFLFVSECGEKYLLKLCPDETLLSILKEYESKNKANSDK